MKTNPIPLIDIFKTLINHRCKGDRLLRQEIMQAAKENDCYFSEHFIDTTRRQLTVCGYLGYTGRPGEYIVLGHIPHNISNNSLRKMYDALLSTHKDEYINNSKITTEKYLETKK